MFPQLRRGSARILIAFEARRTALEGESRGRARRAFTLVEMVVVVAIVLVIVGIAMPALSSLWADRKLSESVNTLQGVFKTTRARAVSGLDGQVAILFYLDDQGTQRVVRLSQAKPPNPPPAGVTMLQQQIAYGDVFVAQQGQAWTLPPPLRVVPRYAINPEDDPSGPYATFGDAELVNDDFEQPPAESVNQAQRHRNYFTVVFSTDGSSLVRRNVLVQDADVDEDNVGDMTGLHVEHDHASRKATVRTYYSAQDDSSVDIDPSGVMAIPLLVAETGSTVAINLPSVDGLLVYDDSLYRAFDAPARREFLQRSAVPMYIHRFTGGLIEGPKGESVVH